MDLPHDAVRNLNRLHRILEAAKLLNSTIDLSEVTGIILRLVRDEVGVDRGSVFVVDRERQLLRSLVAQGVDGQEITLPIGQGIAGTVASTGEIMDIPDAYSDPRFDSSFDPVLGYRTRDIYCMPIVNRTGGIVGVLELMNRTHPLSEEDESFLAGVSVHVGLALDNARMHQEIVEKRKIERELVLAREIQQNFCPELPESYAGVQICGNIEMCDAVGGDYLGYFRLPNDRFIMIVGDVSGKGIGAALVMSSLHATCRALVRHVHALEHIASILNETFVETTAPQTFVTMLIMLVDPKQRRVHYIRAGHNPPFRVTPSGEVTVFEDVGGPPVGLLSRLHYSREITDLEPGSSVVIYTDGVSEAENAVEEQFGMDRLASVLKEHRASSAKEMHAGIRHALKEFVGDSPTHDDSTLVVMKMPD